MGPFEGVGHDSIEAWSFSEGTNSVNHARTSLHLCYPIG